MANSKTFLHQKWVLKCTFYGLNCRKLHRCIGNMTLCYIANALPSKRDQVIGCENLKMLKSLNNGVLPPQTNRNWCLIFKHHCNPTWDWMGKMTFLSIFIYPIWWSEGDLRRNILKILAFCGLCWTSSRFFTPPLCIPKGRELWVFWNIHIYICITFNESNAWKYFVLWTKWEFRKVGMIC